MAKALQPYGLATQPLTISSKEGEVTFSIQQDPNSNKPYARFSRRRLVPSISGMKTETELEEIIWLGQENETFEQLVMYFGQELFRRRQLQTNPILAAILHLMCENVCIIGQQLALYNDICSTVLRQTEVAKSIPAIASKEANLKSELASLKYKSGEKLRKFFEVYSDTTIPLGSDGHTYFTPWEGESSDIYRLYECGFGYVNPPEKLIVIGYMNGDEDIVTMVGTKTGQVFMDKDEIVYIVAESLPEFADQGCRKDPKFFDYYLARPNDPNSLPCAAGTCEDEDIDCRGTYIGHDPKELEAARETARQLAAESWGFPDEVNKDQLLFPFPQYSSTAGALGGPYSPWPIVPTESPSNTKSYPWSVEAKC